MKWLFYLLSFYMLLSCAVPCSDDEDCCTTASIEKTHTGKKSGNDNKQSSPCSSLFPCGTCHGVVIPDTGFDLITIVHLVPKEGFYYKQYPLSSFTPPIWQPPQAV